MTNTNPFMHQHVFPHFSLETRLKQQGGRPQTNKEKVYKSILRVCRKQETKSLGPKSDENFHQSRERTKACHGVERGMPVRKCQGLKGGDGGNRGQQDLRGMEMLQALRDETWAEEHDRTIKAQWEATGLEEGTSGL